jgi:biopolymer transport protein ExbB
MSDQGARTPFHNQSARECIMSFSAGPSCKRLLTVLFCALVALTLLGIAGPKELAPAIQAQEGGADNKPADAGGGGGSDSSTEEKSMIKHMLESLGPVFLILLGFVSVSLIAIIVLLAMDLRMSAAVPPDFVADFTDIVNKRQFKAAYDLARNDSSYLGRVMTTGMGRLQYGIEDSREAAFQMVDTIKASKEQLIAYLATIGTLGPLFGLVGTVYGMIKAFMVLGSGQRIDPQGLANAISHALVVTLVGVGLSVPAIFFHTFFRNRVIRLAMDTSNVADDLLTQMYHNSKKAAAGPSSPDVAPDGRSAAAGASPIKAK